MARLTLDDAAWTSPWRRRSTAEKSVLCLGLLLIAVTSPGPPMSLMTLAIASVIALLFARVSARQYLLALLGPGAFVLIGAGVIAIHLGGALPQTVWQWGPFSATRDSVSLAAEVSTRSIASFAALVLFAATTPMTEVLTGLRRLRVPEVLIDIAGLIYRMLFALLDAAATILEAQASRLGFSSGRSARRSVGLLGGAVLIQAWNRAGRLEAGLAGRGYSGSLQTCTAPRPASVRFVLITSGLLVALAITSALIAVTR